ncbi:MAG: hypothetical protein Tsb0017_18800 [Geothermobacteraceae bacterium]
MEPTFIPQQVSRYSQRDFPAYRFLPFTDLPHPRNDPRGHSWGKEEVPIGSFDEQAWRECEPYLYGVDLFNHGYWWEAHEAWEGLWLVAGRESLAGQFLQGLIQLAGAQLKRFTGVPRGARLLSQTAFEKLALPDGVYLGIDGRQLVELAKRLLEEDRNEYPRIELEFGDRPRTKG